MMRNSSRRELYKLRELVHFMLRGAGVTARTDDGALLCAFCLKEFEHAPDFAEHGNSVGPKFALKITVHHVDGCHDNNNDSNKALCHTTCHKRHHRNIANAAKAAKGE